MNRSILKHEFKSMKWILLLSIILSLFLVILFNIFINNEYGRIFRIGIQPNQAVIQEASRDVSLLALILFTILSVIQIFMQFRSEKGQEVARFLKSLPIESKEFFKIKLITGIINITIGFIILFIGLIIVRHTNMFWIKDIYDISIVPKVFIQLDNIFSILVDLGLTYLIVVSFYTFLFMVQYTFTNVVGGIVTGVLVWLSPIFIVASSVYVIAKFGETSMLHSSTLYNMNIFADKLLPWFYLIDNDYIRIENFSSIRIISNLGLKYIICMILIIVSILIAYRFAKKSRIEDEDKIITFKISRQIFKLGVSICSALLVPTITVGIMGIDINNIIFSMMLLIGLSLGYFVSNKITKVGNR